MRQMRMLRTQYIVCPSRVKGLFTVQFEVDLQASFCELQGQLEIIEVLVCKLAVVA